LLNAETICVKYETLKWILQTNRASSICCLPFSSGWYMG